MKKCFCCCFKLRWYFHKTAIALSPGKCSGITRTKKYLTTQFYWVDTSLESSSFFFFFEVFLNLCSKLCMHAESLQSCPTLYDPMDHSRPGSSVHGILQARILEWIALSSFRGSIRPRYQTCISYVSCIGRQVLYH